MRATLEPRKDRLVDLLRDVSIFTDEDHTSAWATQRFVCRRCDDIKPVVKWIAKHSPSDQSSDVCHIGNRDRANLFRDVDKFLVVELTRVRRKTSENDLRLMLERGLTERIVVNLSRLDILHFVADEVEDLVDICGWVAVCKVAAVLKMHPEHRVARLHKRKIHRNICRCPRKRLHVGELTPEELFCSIDCELLDRIGILLPTVVSSPGVSF